jgi:hypothetical protein
MGGETSCREFGKGDAIHSQCPTSVDGGLFGTVYQERFEETQFVFEES